MKSKSLQTLLLAAALAPAALIADTATTTPVGYVTQTLKAGGFSFVGLTLHNATVSAGVIASADASSVTVTGASFDTLLTAGATYILELANGTIQEVTAWSATTLTTPEDISAQITGGTTTYKLRKAATVSSVFGAANSAGLTPSVDGTLDAADTLLIPNSSGSFDTVFFFNDGAGTTGWYNDAFEAAENKVLNYADSFLVNRVAGSDIPLVVSGELKKNATSGLLSSGYSFLGSVAPVGSTFGNSGLKNYITASADGDFTTVDNVLLPQADGSFKTAFYYNDGAGTESWYDDAFTDVTNLELPTAILIYNVGAAKSYSISTPTSYSSL